MLKFIGAFLLSVAAWSATTTVSQSIVGPDGLPASGTVNIRITAPCAAGADYVGAKTISRAFSGSLSVKLVPNDTCTPAGTSYTVGWTFSDGRKLDQVWVVPTSGSPVSVDSVAIPVAPTPSVAVALTQLSQGGASTNQPLCWTGTSWAPGNCGSAGTHALTHASAGSDPVTPAAIGAEPVDANIVRTDGSGSVAVGCTMPGGAPAGSVCVGGNLYIQTGSTTPGFDSYDGTAHFNAPSVSAGSYTILLSGIAASTDLTDAANISTLTGNQTITGDKIYSGSNTYQGVQDASGAAHTTPAKTGAASAKPGTCSVGEEYFATDSTAGNNKWYCTATNTWTQQSTGNATCDASDPTCLVVWEPFVPSSNTSNSVGALGWNFVATATMSAAAADGVHWRGVTVTQTSPAANVFARLNLQGATGVTQIPNLLTTTNWTNIWKFKTPSSLTELSILIGFAASGAPTSTGTQGVYLRYDNNTGCTNTGSDATWIYQARDGSAGNVTTATGPAISPSTEYWLQIRSIAAGTVKFKLKAEGGAWGAEQDIATHVPAVNLVPYIGTITCDTNAKAITAREFRLVVTGLN